MKIPFLQPLRDCGLLGLLGQLVTRIVFGIAEELATLTVSAFRPFVSAPIEMSQTVWEISAQVSG